MYTTRIKSIKKIGKEQVYDFKVPNYHNFILGNNIIVHNSGKSTLCIQLAKRVSSVFTRLKRLDEETVMYYWEKVNKQTFPTFEDFIKKLWELKKEKAYFFKLREKTIYTRDKIIKFFDGLHDIAVGDEMVISGFSRDFYNDEQKDLIKIINTNRDKNHCFFGAIPSFNTLDIQIKGLTKVRITVIRRGLALIHTPNSSMMYGRDKWDSAYNEKIERDWLKKKVKKPPYSKFTTVRGIVKFPDLPNSTKRIYEEVKDSERNIIAKEQYKIGDDKEEQNPIKKLAKQVVENGIKNGTVLDGFAMSMGTTSVSLRERLRREIKNMGKNPKLSAYYWDTQDKKVGKSKKESELSLIEKIKTR